MVTDKIVVFRTLTVELIREFWLKIKRYIDPVKMIACLTYLFKALLKKFWTGSIFQGNIWQLVLEIEGR